MFNSSLNLRQTSNQIASRIQDGIFIGNYIVLNEQQYLSQNKITHVVNCAASEIQAPSNLKVLNFYWKDEDYQTIIDISNVIEIITFVKRAVKKGESVLFCCLSGQSRSLSALIAYLMYRYQWSLLKVFQYINIKKKEIEIRATFLNSLLILKSKT
ncbi:unnamed protein product [Paramecium sonneborni]|uniref:Tyrosine-protein phosphatase domain-containing protein n=1 Tax=Paramecium sonneborni TaxID=65129 RepID=A0A8S1QEW9_9CILI|nr:unnamed protein product [Paramecium sonneborni]